MSRTANRRNSSARGNAKPKRRPQQSRRRKQPGMLDRAVAALPGGERTARRITSWTFTLLALALALVMASWIGLTSSFGLAIANGLGDAGFRVKQIEISGNKRMDRNVIYRALLDQQSRAMPLVDLASIRKKLLDQGWIEDAQVSRRLPDTLVVHVEERAPAAVWQNDGQLMLIDGSGTPLEPVSQNAMPQLPVLVGEDANTHAKDFLAMMKVAPSLKPLVRGANWIGDRRWTLTFESGEQLLLPEGQEIERTALRKFVEMDRKMGLLGQGYRRFDMRDPTRLVVKKGKDDGTSGGDKVIDAPVAARSDPLSKA